MVKNLNDMAILKIKIFCCFHPQSKLEDNLDTMNLEVIIIQRNTSWEINLHFAEYSIP